MDEAGDGLQGEEDGNETEDGDQRPTPTQASRSNATNPTPVPQIHGEFGSRVWPMSDRFLTLKVSQNHIMQLLGRAGLRRIRQTHGVSNITIGLSDDDDGDNNNGGFGFLGTRRSARRKRDNNDQLPKVPNEEGRKLIDSGTFGSNEYYKDMLRRRKAKLGRRLLSRELGIDKDYSHRANKLISQVLRLPSSLLSVPNLHIMLLGSYTFIERRYHNPLQFTMLFRSIFRRRQFLLLMCSRFPG